MGLLDRSSDLLNRRVNDLLEGFDDPKAEREYNVERMRDELERVKQAIVDLVTEKKRLQRRSDRLESQIEERNVQARKAVRAGDEDLARSFLREKQEDMATLEEIEGQIDELETAQEELLERSRDLETRVDRYRAERAKLDARERLARAESTASGASGGVASETGRRVDDASDEIEEQEARAAALEELEEQGFFEDEDEYEAELDRLQTDSAVEDELATLRKNIRGEDVDVDDDERVDTDERVNGSDVDTDADEGTSGEVDDDEPSGSGTADGGDDEDHDGDESTRRN